MRILRFGLGIAERPKLNRLFSATANLARRQGQYVYHRNRLPGKTDYRRSEKFSASVLGYASSDD
jgi:hypothetical protein